MGRGSMGAPELMSAERMMDDAERIAELEAENERLLKTMANLTCLVINGYREGFYAGYENGGAYNAMPAPDHAWKRSKARAALEKLT